MSKHHAGYTNTSNKRKKWSRILFVFQKGVCALCVCELEHPDKVRAEKKMLLGHAPTLDHFVPASEGGPFAIWNMLLVHRTCNDKRGVGPVPPHTLAIHGRIFDAFYLRAGQPWQVTNPQGDLETPPRPPPGSPLMPSNG